MREFRWNLLKSERLKKTRGVSFEEIVRAELLAVQEHPKRDHQSIMLFKYRGYVWVVPFVDEGDAVFLKTLFPSRKYTRILQGGRKP